MADNIKAGMNYEINLTGNVQEKLKIIRAQIEALKANAGKENKGVDAQAQKLIEAYQGQIAKIKKLISLANRRAVASEKLLATETRTTELKEKQFQAYKKLEGAANKEFQTKQASATATIKQVNLSEKRLAVEKQITDEIARQKNPTVSSVKASTGLPKNAITQTSKELAHQQALLDNIAVDEQRRVAAAKALSIAQNNLSAELAVANKTANAEQKAFDTERRNRLKLFGQLRKQQQAEELEAERLIAAERRMARVESQAYRDNSKVGWTEQSERSARRLNQIYDQVNNRAKEIGTSMKATAHQMGVARGDAKALNIQFQGMQNYAQKLLFTFRRLVGVLAIFTLARKFAQAIGSAVGEMSRFNSQLEGSRLSFGALIAAVGNVYDEEGNLLEGAEAFNAALEASDDQMIKLRKEALKTTATFEDLVSAYQVALGPGLAAGLNLDEVRDTAINIAKAAGALQVPTNQLSEEIRSLVNGTIKLNNTRLAAIGVTNTEIKLARQQGNLYEYLGEKLESFAVASDQVAKSYAALQSQVRDAVSSLLAEGSVEYFDELKTSMKSLVDALVDVDEIGSEQSSFGLNQTAVEGIKEFSSGLAAIINDFRELSGAEDTLGGIKATMMAIGTSLKIISSFTTPLIVGIVKGAALLLAVVGYVGKIALAVRDIIPKPIIRFLQTIITMITAILTIIGLINALIVLNEIILGRIGTWVGVINARLGITTAWETALVALRSTSNVLLGITKALIVGINALLGGMVGIVIALAAVALGVIYLVYKLYKHIKKSRVETDKASESAKNLKKYTGDIGVQVATTSALVKGLSDEYSGLVDEIRKLSQENVIAKISKALSFEGQKGLSPLIDDLYEFTGNLSKAEDEAEGMAANIAKITERVEELKAEMKEIGPLFEEISEKPSRSGLMLRMVPPTRMVAREGVDKEDLERVLEIQRELDPLHRSLNVLMSEYEKAMIPINAIRAELVKKTMAELEAQRIANGENYLAIEALQIKLNYMNDAAGLFGGLFSESALEAKKLNFEASQTYSQLKDSVAEAVKLQQALDSGSFEQQLELKGYDEDQIAKILAQTQASLDNQTLSIQLQIEASLLKQAKAEREQSLADNDVGAAFTYGLETFIDSVDNLATSMYEIMSELPVELADTISSALVDSLQGEDVDEKEVASDFLAQVLQQMVSQLIQVMLSGLLNLIGVQTAAQILAAQMAAEGVKRSLDFAGLELAITNLISALMFNSGVKAAGGYDGGRVTTTGIQSLYSGGKVGFSRPSYIDPRDTVAAWLAPKEHVMTTAATKWLGHDFFDAINALAAGNSSAGARLAGLQAKPRILGMSSGGPVPGSSSGGSSTGRYGYDSDPIIYQPVLVVDESVGEQIYSGSRDAFFEEINRNGTAGGDPNRSGYM